MQSRVHHENKKKRKKYGPDVIRAALCHATRIVVLVSECKFASVYLLRLLLSSRWNIPEAAFSDPIVIKIMTACRATVYVRVYDVTPRETSISRSHFLDSWHFNVTRDVKRRGVITCDVGSRHETASNNGHFHLHKKFAEKIASFFFVN